jgi:hypothetical protein
LFGGQAGALTEATWDEATQALNGNGFDGQRFLQGMSSAGVLDPGKMLIDTATGVLTAELGKIVADPISQAVAKRFGQAPTSGVPVIRFNYRQITIDLGPHAGLTMEFTQFEKFVYSITNGTIDTGSTWFQELVNQWLTEWAQQQQTSP